MNGEKLAKHMDSPKTATAYLTVSIRGEVLGESNGVATLRLTGMPISQEDNKTLTRLFPDFEKQVDQLLAKQALFHSIE